MLASRKNLLFGIFGLMAISFFACSETTEPKVVPVAPHLNSLTSPNLSGDYIISWTTTLHATSYLLQKASDSSFSHALPFYSGPQTSVHPHNIPNGNYYYRVKASNENGSSGWSNSAHITVNKPESITPPYTPQGPYTGNVGQDLTFTTSSAFSNLGHTLQYQFSWENASSLSPWLAAPEATHAFVAAGTYNIKAHARCAAHTGVISIWSSSSQIVISNPTHEVNKPDQPSGPTIGYVNQTLSFSSGGTTCSRGHSVEYRFDWNDLPHSNWSSSSSAQKSWDYALSTPK